MPHRGSIAASHGRPPGEGAGTTKGQPLPTRAAGQPERPVLPAGGLRRTGRLAALPLRHAARTAAAATRLSRMATDQVAARSAEQLFGTLGELKGGAAKLGQAMSVFEAAMPRRSPPLDTELIAHFDVPPYVNSADQSGAVPFLDIANQYILAGAQYDPQVLAGLSARQIASQLGDPSSPVAQAIDGSAQVIVAAIDHVLHDHAADGSA
jgi:hypothetical protein